MATFTNILEFIGIDKATKPMNNIAKASNGLGSAFSGLLKVAAPLIAFFGAKASLDAFNKQALALEKLAIETDRTGESMVQFTKQATAMQKVGIFGDEDIIAAQSLLLQFDNLKGRVTEITPIIADFAAGTGRELGDAAAYIGETLALPYEGLSRLEEQGIIFNDVTKDMIKSMQENGEVTEAQNIIMLELEERFGGLNKAARATTTGGLKAFTNSLGDSTEILGAVGDAIDGDLIENLTDMVDSFNNFAVSNEGIEKVGLVLGVVAAAIGNIMEVARGLGSNINSFIIQPLMNIIAPGADASNAVIFFTRTIEIMAGVLSFGAAGIGQIIVGLKALGEAMTFQGDKAKESYNEFVKIGNAGSKALFDSISKSNDEIARSLDGVVKTTTKSLKDSMGKITGEYQITQKQIKSTNSEIGNTKDKLDSIANSSFIKNDPIVKLFENMKKGAMGVKDVLGGLAGFGSQVGGIISDSFGLATASIDNELALIEEKYNEQIEALEQKQLKENELLEEQYDKKYENILSEESSIQERNDTLNSLEDEHSKNIIENEKKQAAEKKAIDDKLAAETYALDVKKFKSEQAQAISSIWINAGVGILQGFSQGLVIGSIQAATITALAGVQTGVVASQPPPIKSFKAGGYVAASVSGTQALIGEGGSGEYIVPESEYNNLTNNNGGNSYNINISSMLNKDEIRQLMLDIKNDDVSTLGG